MKESFIQSTLAMVIPVVKCTVYTLSASLTASENCLLLSKPTKRPVSAILFLPDSNYKFPAAGRLSGDTIKTVSTFQNISVYWKPVEGTPTREALVRYRMRGTQKWVQAQSLWFDDRNADSIGANTARSKEYRGSIVNLRSGTVYEIEVFLTGVNKVARTTASTWHENFPVEKTIALPAISNNTLVITKGGSASGYVLYTSAGKSATIDVKNLQDYDIDVRAPYVIIRGLQLKGARQHGIFIADNMTDVIIEKNDISGWGRIEADGWGADRDAGVSSVDEANTGLRRIVIQFNKIHHPRSNSNNWTQNRNAFSSGFHPSGPQSVSFNYTLGQLVIRGNYIYSDSNHYFNDGIGGAENYSFISGFPGPDSDIYDNSVSNCWDDAIESEGMNQNVRVFNNYIDLAFVAHGVSATSIGPLYVYRNITYRLQRSPADTYNSGNWFKSQGYDAFGGRVYVYHNTMLTNQESGISDVGKTLGNTISRNNILRSVKRAVIDRKGDPHTSCDYDLIDGSIATVNQKHEIHAIYAVPRFDVNAPLQARGLLPHSPGRDNGAVRIPNFNDNFKGKAPDMGAVEN